MRKKDWLKLVQAVGSRIRKKKMVTSPLTVNLYAFYAWGKFISWQQKRTICNQILRAQKQPRYLSSVNILSTRFPFSRKRLSAYFFLIPRKSHNWLRLEEINLTLLFCSDFYNLENYFKWFKINLRKKKI